MKGDLLATLKIFEGQSYKARKNQKGEPLVSSGFAKARKSFHLKQGLKPETTLNPLRRISTVLKCGTCRMTYVVWRRKKKQDEKFSTRRNT